MNFTTLFNLRSVAGRFPPQRGAEKTRGKRKTAQEGRLAANCWISVDRNGPDLVTTRG